MRKLFISAVAALSIIATTATAQNFSPLKGFAYGEQDAPRGY